MVGIRVGQSLLLAGLGVALSGTPSWAAPSEAGPPGHLVLVQAVPGDSLDVAIDGRNVRQGAAVGAVLGPFAESPGRHQVTLTDVSSGERLVSTVDVAPGSSSDVVVHLPAEVGGAPVINAYRTPRAAIAPGKARILLAHTATVAPADVRVDGAVVFRDIANGEYATADLAAGDHTVSLLPTGLDDPPILGPLDLTLEPGTVTMVYAVGSPRAHSMKVIVHRAALTSTGVVAPDTIATGSAGLAAGVPVVPFGEARVEPSTATHAAPWVGGWSWVVLVLALGSGVLLRRHPRRRGAHRAS